VVDELAVGPVAADAGIIRASRTLGKGRHSAAASDQTLAIAYVEGDTNSVRVALATFSNKAVGLNGPLLVTGAPGTLLDSDPVVAGLPCDVYAAAWTDFGGDGDELGIGLRIIDLGNAEISPILFANATALKPSTSDPGTIGSQFDPDIVWTGSQLVVAWSDDSVPATAPDLRVRSLDVSSGVVSDVQTLAATAHVEGDVALAPFAGAWAAAWRDAPQPPPDGGNASGLETIEVQAGSTHWSIGPAFPPGPAGVRPALIGLDATHLAVTYAVGVDRAGSGVADGSKIQLAVLDLAAPGSVSGTDISPTAPGSTSLSQSQPNLAIVNDSPFLAWWSEAALGSALGEELWLKALAWDGAKLDTGAAEVPLPRAQASRRGDQELPALASTTLPPGGALLVAWDDLGKALDPGEATGDVAIDLDPLPLLRTDGGQ
jgi:hypothetical protein